MTMALLWGLISWFMTDSIWKMRKISISLVKLILSMKKNIMITISLLRETVPALLVCIPVDFVDWKMVLLELMEADIPIIQLVVKMLAIRPHYLAA